MQSLLAVFGSLASWNWFIVGVLLFILETLVPGVHFLWFGLCAIVVGVIAVATGMAWQWQMIAFGVISVLMVFWIRRFYRVGVAHSDQPDLNARATVHRALADGGTGHTKWPRQGSRR
jgi:inner membrane protein